MLTEGVAVAVFRVCALAFAMAVASVSHAEPSLVQALVFLQQEQLWVNDPEVAVDRLGFVYMTGQALRPESSATDVVVIKFTPDLASVVYTYRFGAHEFPTALVVDGDGAAYVAGTDWSDGFVAKVAPSGERLIFRYRLGGAEYENISGLAVDGRGRALLVGETSSDDFPTTGPPLFPSTDPAWPLSGFVARLDDSGTRLVYSRRTYSARAVAMDTAGTAYVAGQWPNGFQLFTVASSGAVKPLRTFESHGGFTTTYPLAIAVDAAQGVIVGGITSVHDLGTPGAFQPFPSTSEFNGFVMGLRRDGSTAFATYIGGSGIADAADASYVRGVGVDRWRNVFVTGTALPSPSFPALYSIKAPRQGDEDAFVMKLTPNGGAVVYSSLLGGDQRDFGSSLAVTDDGHAVVVGTTESTTFPDDVTLQPWRGTYVARLAPAARWDDIGIEGAAPEPRTLHSQPVEYVFSVMNGANDLEWAEAVVTLPIGFTSVSCNTERRGTCEASADGWRIRFAGLPAFTTTRISVHAEPPCNIRNGTWAAASARVWSANAEGPQASTNNSASVSVEIQNLPPHVSAVEATPRVIRSVTGAWVPVSLTYAASDACAPPPECAVRVSSSGSDATPSDWIVATSKLVYLRATGSTTGVGRVYSIIVSCADAAGNVTSSTAWVQVRPSTASSEVGRVAGGRIHWMLDEYGGIAAYELDGSGFALRGGGRVDVIASCESQCREGASLDISQQIRLIRGNNAVSGTIDGDPVGDLQLEGEVVIFANPVNVPQDVTPGAGIYTLQTSFMAVGTFDAYNEAGQVVRAMRFSGRGTATIAVLFGSVEEVTYAFSDEPPSIHPLGD